MSHVLASIAPLDPIGGMPLTVGAGDTFPTLVGIFVLFVAAKLGEEAARRLGQPGVVGELLGGFVVGPFALNLVQPGEAAAILSELGVVILLFAVGLEVRFDELIAVGRPAVVTAVVGMILPIIAGVAVGLVAGQSGPTSAFIGLALAATSIGITSRVLAELGVLDRTFARVILGAAVIDDVLALILIGVVSGASTGNLSLSTGMVAVSALGLVGLGFVAARRARGVGREAFTWPMFADTPLVPAVILMLALALLAAWLGLAAIIGAFVAGLIVAETEAREELEHETRPLVQIFTPFFFALTGAQLQLGALADPAVALLALVIAVLGIATKVLGGVLGARRLGRWASLTVGIGMAPRGEVGIVVATIGLSLGILDARIFSVVLIAVVATTLFAPLALKRTIPPALLEAGHR